MPPILVRLVLVDHLLPGGFEDRIEAPDHDEGKHDLLIVRLLVVATQQLSDRPHERFMIVDRLGHWSSLSSPYLTWVQSQPWVVTRIRAQTAVSQPGEMLSR